MYNDERALYEFFDAASNYVKMNKFLTRCKISQPCFSNYLKYADLCAVKKEKLNELYIEIILELENLLKFA